MRQIRKNVFETNSSSTHSLSFSCDNSLKESRLPVSEDGYIHVKFDEFGWEIEDYSDQMSKLSYLITMCAQVNGIYVDCYDKTEQEETIKEFMGCSDFIKISNKIAEYTNTNGLYVDYSSGYIDHQSVEGYSIDGYLSINSTTILDFVFGNVVVHTDNDNY